MANILPHNHIIPRLWQGGGAEFNSKITSTLSSMESVEKVFSAALSEGQDVRRKTHFARKTGSKVKFLYKGRSAVVGSSDSPLIFYFNLESQ